MGNYTIKLRILGGRDGGRKGISILLGMAMGKENVASRWSRHSQLSDFIVAIKMNDMWIYIVYC